jgi:hypothetical protein
MRSRDTIISLVCFVLAAALLTVAGMQLDYINSQRKEMKLITNEPLENAPPSLAFATVAMGAFRGLVVDILWMRADNLKDQGQFFDAKQLAEWITILQPRFAAVWEFHAWNMAYNISVALPATEPEQRWQWVKNGYELLRDKGIPKNPKSILLYREMARIFQHKIGAVSDDAHKYYKLQLVEAMEPLLGAADNEYFKELAEAPTHLSQIESDANFTPIIEALKAADEAFKDNKQFVSNYLSLKQNPARFKPQAFNVRDRFRASKALKKFDIFANAWQLRKVWKLDPVKMQWLNQHYGPIDWSEPNTHTPLDWRHPDPHAIYWAVKGLEIAGSDEFSVDEINADRIVNHSLQNLFRYGKIFVYEIPAESALESSVEPPEQTKEVFLRPDFRMFEVYNKSTLARMEKYKDIDKKGSYESLQNGHRNMLVNAVLMFYQAGHKKQAGKIYNDLRSLYPREEFQVPLVMFVRNRFVEELRNLGIHDAKEQVIALLRESYFMYAIRNDDESAGREKLAQEIHSYYQGKYLDENRIDLPEYKLLQYFALLDVFNDDQIRPSLRLRLVNRIKIEKPDLYKEFEQVERTLIEKEKQSEQTE